MSKVLVCDNKASLSHMYGNTIMKGDGEHGEEYSVVYYKGSHISIFPVGVTTIPDHPNRTDYCSFRCLEVSLRGLLDTMAEDRNKAEEEWKTPAQAAA